MKSYRFVNSIIWDAKIGHFSFISIGFKTLYAYSRSGKNTNLSYSLAISRAFSLPTY
jgi:hypothetical protein